MNDLWEQRLNTSFPSFIVLLFQNESKCETILMKMSLIYMKMNLYAKSFALRLVLIQRQMAYSLLFITTSIVHVISSRELYRIKALPD